MVNVGTGNMLVQSDDMAVAHKGISLAFRRTYNSQSQHDTTGTDGAVPSMYGNGWTNTFDAHLSGSRTGTISVWDIDGARYDYTVGADGVTMVPPPGQHATLTSDGATGYFWTKKSGTTYYFWAPDGATAWPSSVYQQYGGYAGRLYQIIARNRYTYLNFAYTWDNASAAPGGKISAIAAQTESGSTANLSFLDVGGHRLLSQLTYPDGATSVSYGYDASGNLLNVAEPPNNAAGTRMSHSYGYQTLGTYTVMAWADSPRWESCASGCGSEGAWLQFGFTGTSASLALNAIGHGGVVNPVIPNGSSATTLQSGYPTTAVWYLTEYYTIGTSTPTFRDSDGHATNWVVDSHGRPTQTQECTATTGGTCTGTVLVSNETWDSDNNLATKVDPRNNETYYLYDPRGNTTVVAGPYTTTSQGSFFPTKIFDYDTNNNVVAYCDENEVHQAGVDYQPLPFSVEANDALCASQMGSVPYWHATYSNPSWEPAGELTTMTTPSGYTRTLSYAPGQQAGADFGLPTAVTGDAIVQLDGTTRTPAQTFWYDGTGNLRCYSKGNGTTVLSYDTLSRVASVADPDDSSANGSSLCGKSSGTSGWNTQTTYTYFPDGSKQTVQSPSERAFGVSTSYTYDLDGNVLSETAHHGCMPNQTCNPGVTQKWYDGVDRLVQVQQPWDPRTYTWPNTPGQTLPYDGGPWMMRYFYDISEGGTVRVEGSAPFAAHGNLYKTQKGTGPSFSDVSGSAFDALDRETTKFSWLVGSDPAQIEPTQLQYDGGVPATLGLLTKKTNPAGESVTYAYDERGHINSQTYAGENGVTPSETTGYDANERVSSVTSSRFGTQQYAYDTDGRLSSTTEPGRGGLTGAAQISYAYYRDGKRSALSISSPGFTQPNALAYSYRPDGLLQTQTNAAFAAGTWSKSYTDAGRLRALAGAGAPSYTYDATGQLQSDTDVGQTISYTHDPEGSILSETFPSVWPVGATAPIPVVRYSTINVRGELIDDTPPGTGPNAFITAHRTQTAGGCMARQTLVNPPPEDPSTGLQQDGRSCLTTYTGIMGGVGYNNRTYPQGHTTQFAFDAAGRANSTIDDNSMFQSGGSGSTNPASHAPASARSTHTVTTTAFDAENHTVSRQQTKMTTQSQPDQGTSTTTTSTDAATTLGWGPNGHPVLLHDPSRPVTATQDMTLHWDGDMVLFVTDANGAVIDFKVGLDGEITPRDTSWAGLTMYDRDEAGVVMAARNATGQSNLMPLDPLDASSIGFGPGTSTGLPTPSRNSRITRGPTASRLATSRSTACARSTRRWAVGRLPTRTKVTSTIRLHNRSTCGTVETRSSIKTLADIIRRQQQRLTSLSAPKLFP